MQAPLNVPGPVAGWPLPVLLSMLDDMPEVTSRMRHVPMYLSKRLVRFDLYWDWLLPRKYEVVAHD